MTKLKVLTGRIPEPSKLKTGSVGLNRALEGGLMGGRIQVFWGPKSSGKTTQALFVIAQAQREGKTCLYIDAEKTYTTAWAERCGVDVDELKYLRGNSVEKIASEAIPMIEKGEVDVVVIDSLASIFMDSYLDEPEAKGMAIYARSANNLVSKILGAMGFDTQIIIIAHATMGNSGGMGFSMQAKISEQLKHWASTIIKFRLGMSKDKDIRPDGSKKVYWNIDKSKQSVYPIGGDYWISLKTPVIFIDQAHEVATLCKEEQVVQGTTWLNYGDQKWQGVDKFAAALRSDVDLLEFFTNKLNEVAVVPDEEVDEDDGED